MDVFIPSKIGALRDLLLGLLRDHERDGTIPTNARFLFYELVQRGQLSKEKTGARRPDQNLHDALTDIREDGRIPWDWIVDETRSLDDYTGYPIIKEGVLSQLPYIALDPWRSRAPMILTESRSLIAPMLRPGDRVIYLGDLDLAGGHIEELEQEIGGPLDWERLALTEEQVQQYDLPVIIKHDRRYKDGRPHEAVETEAISQAVLVDILRGRLDSLLPEPLSRVQERERRQRLRIEKILRGTAP
jgi:hypothetical protein